MSSFIPIRERPKHQVPGFNNTGSTIVAGVGVTGTESSISLPVGANDPFYGVVRGDTPNQAWASVQTSDKAMVLVGSAGATAGQRAMMETGTGRFVNWAASSGVNVDNCGVFQQTGTVGNYVEMMISAPGVSQQG
jgi:hypothetical protein